MWYKYFAKESWNLRVFRKANLKFQQDDFGMLRHKHVLRWKDFLFRACRTEGAMRGSNFFIGLGMIPVIVWLKGAYYDPAFVAPKLEKEKQNLIAKDAEARAIIFYNRFGAPTRPHRNLEELMAFLGGSDTYDDFADFLSYNTAQDINQDQQKGLDSWMSEKDVDMMNQYRKIMKNGGGH